MAVFLGLLLVAALVDGRDASADARPTPAPQPKRSNTPGMSLSAVERSRGKEHGIEGVRYALRTEGFPKDHLYALYGRWMNGQSAEVTKGARIDETGLLHGPGGDEISLWLAQMFPGEYATFALVSEDRSATAFVEITPFPIQAEGKGGCRLFVRPMEPGGQVFLITGSGFKAGRTLKTLSSSVNESARGTVDGRPDGSVKEVILPAVVGHEGGPASFEASDGDCTVRVDYKWGDQMRSTPPASPTPP
jgi:hypothetical protein